MSENKRPTGGKGVALMRISDPKQDLGPQKALIQKWLDDYGLSVANWFADTGSRLEAYKRESFQELLKKVERREMEWVVIEAVDRLGFRSAWELGSFVTHLQNHDVRLYAVAEGVEVTSDDAFNIVSGFITGLRSTDELKARSHRSLKGRAERFRRGDPCGGVPPYGFDSVAYDRSGLEAWRLVYLGPDKRVQVFPDGRREAFDGPRNTPKRSPGLSIRLAPSMMKERQEWARKIYSWWTSEAIGYLGIATRLNNLGVDALNGKGWSGPRIRMMLNNPAYVLGTVVGNKTGRGKVLGLVGGKEEPVPRVGGKVGKYVKRDTTDYIYADGQFEAIIDRETWEKAQEKANGRGKKVSRPRQPNAWFGGLLVCGRCGKRMAGFRRKQGTEKWNYCCTHHRTYGKASTCKLNRIGHGACVRLLEAYLKETDAKLTMIASTSDPAGAIQALRMESWSRQREYLGTLAEMEAVVRAAGIETTIEADGKGYDACDVKKEYKRLHEARKAELAALIKEKEEEVRGFVRNIPKLTSELAIKVAEEEVDRLGKDIEELRRAAVPLDEQAEAMLRAVREAKDRIRAAQGALAGDDGLKKAEAVRRAVKQITLHFEDVINPGYHEATSRLVRAVFEPLEGDPWEVVPNETPGYRSFIRHHPLLRAFTGEELLALLRPAA